MRRLILAGAVIALASAAPAAATYEGHCDGEGTTPVVRIAINGQNEILNFEFRRSGRPILTEPSLRWQTRMSNRLMTIVATRRTAGEVVARLSLRPVGDSGAWVGTLVMNRRTYWVRCEGFG